MSQTDSTPVPSKVSFRAADAADIAAVVAVLRASRLAFLPYAPPLRTLEEDLAWAGSTLIPAGGTTVALAGDRVVGVLAISREHDCGWIDQLYVDPGRVGQGIGSRLLAHALQALERPVRLYCFQQNLRARAFFERHGFQVLVYGDGRGNQERCPDVLYQLGPA
ncbi:GNAT family N-acetyltransferase [Aquabacterium sp. A7-Y]|uniref:GNAT family N-acetyltransferase n=1 Tax=Aquabacterium sp. A7-Y TaxID=1349605 RepID=UPI00223DF51A|nr:GNAT family N-acetyltransferase [Aquabacterium sp. A7-Y]MCW7537536.1 GNAT family N-acetyltransferase [Aquabacterium sp. A7-Y]